MTDQVAQGGTIRRRATYRTSVGALYDPPDPLVDILDPASSVVVNNATPVRESLGEYYYDYAVGGSADLGVWTDRWSGTVLGVPLTADEEFEVVPSGYINAGDTPIFTWDEYKRHYQLNDDRKKAAIEQLIPWVQLAVRHYSKRAFGEAVTGPSLRSYAYDGSGFLDIDDCTDITQVQVASYTVPTDVWVAKPELSNVDPQTFWWIENLPEGGQISPEMGFLQNMDVLGVPANTRAYVTATWGWPDIPGDVKMAAIWTANAWLEVPGTFTSESIEGYSRTFSLPAGLQDSVPQRAQMILEAYDRAPLV